MSSPNTIRSDQANAEILLWQNRYRIAFLASVAAAAVVLRMLGLLTLTPLVAALGGLRAHLALGLLAVALYVSTIALLDWRVRRRGRAGRVAVATGSTADVLIVFVFVFLVTPPRYYERALILAFFSLQLTLVYFGRRASMVLLAAITAAYVALVALAGALGSPLAWSEQLWTLLLFVLGSSVFITVQGNLNRRLERIVRMFERAEEGDFTTIYDESADRYPDSITLVGRAYNRMRAQLATIALTDPLSSCLNRRGFEQQLAREAARASRSGSELALLAVDVDYFKLVNDTFGHLAGDAVIREIGQLLRDTARTGDVVSRIGGEEFTVLAPATNAAGAFHLATRILETFRKREFTGVEGRIPITVSIGVVADQVRDEHMVEALRARADEALYTAKRGGRNRVVLWTEGMKSRDAGLLH